MTTDVHLTPTEQRLYGALRPGRPVGMLDLMAAAWPEDVGLVDHQSLRHTFWVNVSRMRRKLRSAGQCIEHQPGPTYRLRQAGDHVP